MMTLRSSTLAALLLAAPATCQVAIENRTTTQEDGTERRFDRGSLDVPNVRGRDGLPRIPLKFWRFACEDPASECPPIFILRGGPSFLGLDRELAERGFYEQRIRDFARIADVVVVGQRGIGSSMDTPCGLYERERLDERATDDDRAQRIATAVAACKEKWQQRGFDLSGFNIKEAAADVIAVADALGYDKIIVTGSSFGSHWSMAILRYHPERVARAVLSGLEGPDHTYDMPSATLAGLARIASAAERSDALRDRVPEGGLLAAFRRLAAQLDEQPKTVRMGPFEVLIDGRRLRQCALGTTRRPSRRSGIRTWPRDILRIVDGDLTDAARFLIQRNMASKLPTASALSLDCGSGISDARMVELARDPATAILGRGEFLYRAACPNWPSDMGAEFRKNFEIATPTVLVHGTWDTSTPFDNAIELAPSFLASRFVVVAGGSHGAIGEAMAFDPGFRSALRAFLATGEFGDLPTRVVLPDPDWAAPK